MPPTWPPSPKPATVAAHGPRRPLHRPTLHDRRDAEVAAFAARLDIALPDEPSRALLHQALTHMEWGFPTEHNGRLGFVGLHLLRFLLAGQIARRFPNLPQQAFSDLLEFVSSPAALAKIGSALGIDDALVARVR